jgi:hypothetical protein
VNYVRDWYTKASTRLRLRAIHGSLHCRIGGLWTDATAHRYQAFWGPFIHGSREQDNLYDDKCPSRRAPPRTCPKASPSVARPCAGGAFDSVGRGREGPLPIELYLLHPAFCLCYQKPPPPALSCPSRTRSKASARACSHAPGFRCGRLLRRAPEAGRLCHDRISRRGRKRRMPRAASRKQTWHASP